MPSVSHDLSASFYKIPHKCDYYLQKMRKYAKNTQKIHFFLAYLAKKQYLCT